MKKAVKPKGGKAQPSKGGKKKKQIRHFTIDCTLPVEDGIMDAANFVSRRKSPKHSEKSTPL